jgi:hypothetical protein
MRSLLTAFALTLFGGTAAAENTTIKNPPADSAHATIISGLKEIRDNKWDDWFKNRCSKQKLCFNENSKKSLKTYNLPAMQRRSKNCLKEGDSIIVTRTQGDLTKDSEVKIFIQCEDTAMPVPFNLIKEDGKWLFKSI